MELTRVSIPNQHDVVWYKVGRKHRVEYGHHSVTFASDLEAAKTFGFCVRHALECEGKLDTRRLT
jgi:hypothetical protein